MNERSQNSLAGSISAWYRGGPEFKSWQGQELLILTKKEVVPTSHLDMCRCSTRKLLTEGHYEHVRT